MCGIFFWASENELSLLSLTSVTPWELWHYHVVTWVCWGRRTSRIDLVPLGEYLFNCTLCRNLVPVDYCVDESTRALGDGNNAGLECLPTPGYWLWLFKYHYVLWVTCLVGNLILEELLGNLLHASHKCVCIVGYFLFFALVLIAKYKSNNHIVNYNLALGFPYRLVQA